ncbi:MAG TPA: hypothetical protein VNB06_05505 [Thermoanaerobaculia bacterium]|nr:hypothetical protein [Thermoanaerobaculia bacterium]
MTPQNGAAPASDRGGVEDAAHWLASDDEDTRLADHIAESLAMLSLIHRGHPGHVKLAIKSPERWRDLAAPSLAELPAELVRFAEELSVGGYVSLQGLHRPYETWRAGRRWRASVGWFTGLGIDLDQSDKSWGWTLGRIVDAQDAGELLAPSIILRTGGCAGGRGGLLYLLADEASGGPVPESPETYAQWHHLQGRLLDHVEAALPDCGLDRGPRDPGKLVHVPFSKHPTSGAVVRFWPQCDERGVITYTMPALLDLLGVAAPEPLATEPGRLLSWPEAPSTRRKEPTTKVPGRRAGGIARWSHALCDLERVATGRGGIRPGMRSKFLLLLAFHLHRTGHDWQEVGRELAAANRDRLRRPLCTSEVRDVLRGASKLRHPIAYATVTDWLEVTRDEAEAFGLRVLGPVGDASQVETRAGRRATRRAALAALVATSDGSGLSLRALAARLRADGMPASPETVRVDLRALGSSTTKAPSADQDGTHPPPEPPFRTPRRRRSPTSKVTGQAPQAGEVAA